MADPFDRARHSRAELALTEQVDHPRVDSCCLRESGVRSSSDQSIEL